MALEIQAGDLPDEVKTAILSRKCVAFLGSGVSSGFYVTWCRLVNRLCGACGVSARVTKVSPPEDYLNAAQEAQDANRRAYDRCLRREFGKDVPDVPWLYHTLLSLPFACYLTVNFDPLLAKCSDCDTGEMSIASSHRHYYPALDRKAMAQRSIHYLHGGIGEHDSVSPVTVVLTRREFEEAYENHGPTARLLIDTLKYESIVFVGCRLREPAMQGVFEICRREQERLERLEKASGRPAPRRPPQYILHRNPVGQQEIDGRIVHSIDFDRRAADEATYNRMGLATVWYDAHQGHRELRAAFMRISRLRPVKPSYSCEDPTDGR